MYPKIRLAKHKQLLKFVAHAREFWSLIKHYVCVLACLNGI
jgi:hypothetical protein